MRQDLFFSEKYLQFLWKILTENRLQKGISGNIGLNGLAILQFYFMGYFNFCGQKLDFSKCTSIF